MVFGYMDSINSRHLQKNLAMLARHVGQGDVNTLLDRAELNLNRQAASNDSPVPGSASTNYRMENFCALSLNAGDRL